MPLLPDRDNEVRDERLEQDLRDLARIIERRAPQGMGFALLMFEFEGDSMFWISNAERRSMVKAVQEFVRKQKAKGY